MMPGTLRLNAGRIFIAGMGYVLLATSSLVAGDQTCPAEPCCKQTSCYTDSSDIVKNEFLSEGINPETVLSKYQKQFPSSQIIDNVFAIRSTTPVSEFGTRLMVDRTGGLSIVQTNTEDQRRALFNSDSVEFIAPAFTRAGATMIMTDSINIAFHEKLDRKTVESIVEPLGLEIRKEGSYLLYEVSTNGSSAFDLIDAVEKLEAHPSVAVAEIDTIQKMARTNYTGEYGQKDFGGTSGAVALVAGVAGMVRDANPALDAYQVMDILRETADPGTNSTVELNPDGFLSGGSFSDIMSTVTLSDGTDFFQIERTIQYSNEFGDGIIRPDRAINAAKSVPGAKSDESYKGLNAPVLFDDPLSNLQWYSFNSIFDQSVSGLSDLDIDTIWNSGTFRPDASNTNVRLAIIDDGVAVNHPEINLVRQYDTFSGSTGSTAAQPRSGTGHGTAVAGIMAARDNQIGIVGVLPGYPVVGVRVPAISGDRGNGHFFARVSSVFNGLDFIGSEAVGNPLERYVVAVTTAGIPSYTAIAEDDDTSLLSFVIQSLALSNVVVVLPSGNGNQDISEAITYRDLGPQEQAEMMMGPDGEEIPPLPQSALIVAAVHNAASTGGSPSSKASYSNFGSQVSLAAPSGDDTFNIFQPADSGVARFLKLGMTTTDINLLSMGGNDIREYDMNANFASDVVVEMPTGGVVGVSNWPTAFDRLYSSDEFEGNDFLSRGVIFNTQPGFIEIYPNVTQDENGIFSGTALIQIRDSNNVITSERTLSCSGRFIYQRVGSRRDAERVFSVLSLSGFDPLGNSFNIFGFERFSVIDGNLFGGGGGGAKAAPAENKLVGVPGGGGGGVGVAPPDETGYRIFASVRVQGGGSDFTSGYVRRSNITGSENGGFSGDDEAIDYALGSFYSPTIGVQQSFGDLQVVSGAAVLDSDFDFMTSSPSSTYGVINYSPPPRLGTFFSYGFAGNYFSIAQGSHTAATDQKFIEYADATSFPSYVQMRSPGAVNVIFERNLPANLFVD